MSFLSFPNNPSTQTVRSVKDFGAKGDGSTDDTAAFQTAHTTLDAAGGGLLWVPPSSLPYRIATGITAGKTVSMVGAGNRRSVLQFDDVAQVGINYTAGFAQQSTITADVVEWASTVTVASTTGMAIGQHIFLSEGGAAGPSFFTRITGIAANVITLEEPVPNIFLAVNTPIVNTYNAGGPVEGVQVVDIGFTNAATTPTLRQYFLRITASLDCYVRRCLFKGLGAASASGCYFQIGRGGALERCTFDNINATGTALAAVLDSITCGDMSQNTFRNLSSGATLTRSPFGTMIANRILGNSTGGRALKILAGSNYSAAHANTCSGFAASGFAIVFVSDSWGCVVNGNPVSNGPTNGFGIAVTQNIAGRSHDNVISDNTIKQVGGSGGRSLDTSGSTGPNYVADNITTASLAALKQSADFADAFSGVVDFGTQAAPFTITSPDVSTARVLKVNVSSVGTLTIQAPANNGMAAGELLTLDITNSSGGVLTITWSGAYHQTHVAPVAGKRNQVTFRFDGTNFIQAFAQGPDVTP